MMGKRYQLTQEEAVLCVGAMNEANRRWKLEATDPYVKLAARLATFSKQEDLPNNAPTSNKLELSIKDALNCLAAMNDGMRTKPKGNWGEIAILRDRIHNFLDQPRERAKRPINFHRNTLYCPFLSASCIQEQCMMWRRLFRPTGAAFPDCILSKGLETPK